MMKRTLLAVGLAGTLLWGCTEESKPTEAKPREVAGNLKKLPPLPAKLENRSGTARPVEPMPDMPDPQGADPDLKVGMTRDELMTVMGNCAERTTLIPAYRGRSVVEVFQPRREEACLKRFGPRRIFVAGLTVSEIQPGMDPSPAEIANMPQAERVERGPR